MHHTDELEQVYADFHALGTQCHAEMYACWKERRLPPTAWDGFAQRGFFKAVLERGLPGAVPWCAAALEGFCNGSQDGGFTIAPVCHGVMSAAGILEHGTPELVQQYQDGIIDGTLVTAFAVTEQQTGGTDCFHPRTQLSPGQHGDYVLDGGKWHITNAPDARLFLVWTHDSVTKSLVAVVVDRRWSGVDVGPALAPAGACSSPVGSVAFERVCVPHTHVIRFKSSGEAVLREILTCERVLVAFPCVALMEVMLEKCMAFATQRKVADITIASHQYVQRRLTDMEARLYSVRSMAQKTLEQLLAGAAVSKEASILKMAAANLGMECAEDAMKICATYGLQERAQFHMMYMDLLAATIGGGTEEAHRTVIFKEMLRRRRGSGRPLWIE